MLTDLRDALHTGAGRQSRTIVQVSALLAVLVVASAALTGGVRFSGPRWVPHFKLSLRGKRGQTLPRPPSVRGKQVARSHPVVGSGLGQVLLWILVATAVIGAALLLWRWWARRPSRGATGRHAVKVAAARESPVEPEPEPEPDTPTLRTGIELALERLDDPREPADAIVRAWLGLQETAEESGILRGVAETPTEFTSRIMSRAFADDRAIRTLLRLYLRTRFGDHPVTSEDVAIVRGALEALARTWATTAPPAGAGRR